MLKAHSHWMPLSSQKRLERQQQDVIAFLSPLPFNTHGRRNGICGQGRTRRTYRSAVHCSGEGGGRSKYPVGKHGAPSQVFVADVTFCAGLSVPLAERELAHLRARRVRDGQPIMLFNGCGQTAAATLCRGAALVRTVAGDPVRRGGGGVDVIVSALKSPSRSDWVVEKLTELNVRSVTFTTMKRTVGVAGDERVQRWSRVAVAAAKQCVRHDVPAVRVLSWDACLHHVAERTAAFVVCAGGRSLLDVGMRAALAEESGGLFVVGPEGGFEQAEIDALVEAGCRQVGLGSLRLRVETAAVLVAGLAAQVLNVDAERVEGGDEELL